MYIYTYGRKQIPEEQRVIRTYAIDRTYASRMSGKQATTTPPGIGPKKKGKTNLRMYIYIYTWFGCGDLDRLLATALTLETHSMVLRMQVRWATCCSSFCVIQPVKPQLATMTCWNSREAPATFYQQVSLMWGPFLPPWNRSEMKICKRLGGELQHF